MPLALGRLVLFALGCFGPLRGAICAHGLEAQAAAAIRGGVDTAAGPPALSDDSPDVFLDGFVSQPSIDGLPPQMGFRRPQLALYKRACLANGTNFCFGDNANYCAVCGTCCSSSTSKWCCPSDGICCGSSCCAAGQTCKNQQCYLPVETVTTTSAVLMTTTTHIVTDIATVYHKVVVDTVVNSIVTVTNTKQLTQTNWIYETVTAIEKRDIAGIDDSTISSSTTAGSVEADDYPLTEALATPTPEMAPRAVNPVEAAPEDTMAALQPTTTIHKTATSTVVVTSVASSSTTVVETSTTTAIEILTNTIVLNAKTTVEATSTLTFTSRHPVTLTITRISTVVASPVVAAPSSTTLAGIPALITGVPGSEVSSKHISSPAVAGIAVGSTIGGLTLCLLLFYFGRRHAKRKNELKAITEDYAYLGTGRSDGCHAVRTSSGYGGAPPPSAGNYSGPPPPPSGRRASSQKPSIAHVSLHSDDHGLPPAPTYIGRASTKRSSNSAHSPNSTSSPTSPTSLFRESPQPPQLSMAHYSFRASHMRSESGQTAATSATTSSSTAVGFNSTRNSLRSVIENPDIEMLFAGADMHKRASSSGAGSSKTVETSSHELTMDNYPVELPGQPSARSRTPPEPASPVLEPRLGPLRVVNTPATPKANPEDASEPDDFSLSTLPHPDNH